MRSTLFYFGCLAHVNGFGYYNTDPTLEPTRFPTILDPVEVFSTVSVEAELSGVTETQCEKTGESFAKVLEVDANNVDTKCTLKAEDARRRTGEGTYNVQYTATVADDTNANIVAGKLQDTAVLREIVEQINTDQGLSLAEFSNVQTPTVASGVPEGYALVTGWCFDDTETILKTNFVTAAECAKVCTDLPACDNIAVVEGHGCVYLSAGDLKKGMSCVVGKVYHKKAKWQETVWDGTGGNSFMGQSVAISGDGKVIAISVRNLYDHAGNPTGKVSGGVVYVKTWDGCTWTDLMAEPLVSQNPDDLFFGGATMALSDDGTVLLVGSHEAATATGRNVGKVEVFHWDGSAWLPKGDQLEGQDINGYYGTVSAMTPDGNTLVTGTYRKNNYKGFFEVYQWKESAWEQKGESILGSHLGGEFASDLDINDAGDRVVAAERQYESFKGRVFIYDWDEVSGKWTKATEMVGGEGTTRFGFSVSLNAAGDIVAVGITKDKKGDMTVGSVEVYQEIRGTWSQLGQTIYGGYESDMGSAVSLNADGKTLVVGANLSGDVHFRAGLLRIYKYSEAQGEWVQVGRRIDGPSESANLGGSRLGINALGTKIIAGAKFASDGAMYYKGIATLVDWQQQDLSGSACEPDAQTTATLTPSTSPTVGPSFAPTAGPSFAPTAGPSFAPTVGPSFAPTVGPSFAPSNQPSMGPTRGPSFAPSNQPSRIPTVGPTVGPSFAPSAQPSMAPTVGPSLAPTGCPELGKKICRTEPACEWNRKLILCVDEGETPCADFIKPKECRRATPNNDPELGCRWDTTANACEDREMIASCMTVDHGTNKNRKILPVDGNKKSVKGSAEECHNFCRANTTADAFTYKNTGKCYCKLTQDGFAFVEKAGRTSGYISSTWNSTPCESEIRRRIGGGSRQ